MIKTYFRIIPLVLSLVVLTACEQKRETLASPSQVETVENPCKYDSVKAVKYGADQYGMKKYVVAFLKRGPNKSVDSIQKSELQKAHMQNINRLAEEGKLVLAGPFFGGGDLRGIYIFNVDNLEDAKALTNSDPSIQAGILSMDLKEWYGSAALMAINDLHYSVSKNDIVDND